MLASGVRRGFGYVVALSIIVAFAGAAGMYTFENAMPDSFKSFSDALWWTIMLINSIDSYYDPQMTERRLYVLSWRLTISQFSARSRQRRQLSSSSETAQTLKQRQSEYKDLNALHNEDNSLAGRN